MTGYTRFDNPILEKVLTSNFTKRQLKILLLIIRFSAGCQKTYAVLRKNDYAYAGVSAYCITSELERLVKLRVIKWDAKRDLVWLNPNLQEWAVDRPGEKPGDNLRKFFKIVSKNLLKRQQAVYQNSKSEVAKTARISSVYKEKKENINKYYCKENTILKVLGDYFLKVSPLSQDEVFILRKLVRSYGSKVVGEAINIVSRGNNRAFSHFLKTLDDLHSKTRSRTGGLNSLKPSIKQHLKSTTRA